MYFDENHYFVNTLYMCTSRCACVKTWCYFGDKIKTQMINGIWVKYSRYISLSNRSGAFLRVSNLSSIFRTHKKLLWNQLTHVNQQVGI